MVDPALTQLDRLIDDPDTFQPVRFAAIKDVLDRNGYKPPTQIEVITDAAIEADIARLEAELDL